MGAQLSYPITNQHVFRYRNFYSNSACVHVNGWRPSQEDDHSIVFDLNDTGLCIWAVYDGHGGYKAAEYCSTAIPDALARITDLSDETAITEAILEADQTFLASGQPDGCTACIVLGQPWNLELDAPLGHPLTAPLTKETKETIGVKLLAVNIGDSRAILIHPDGSFDQMTEDHKPQDPVERSRITKAGGSVQNNRVDGSLALSRAIGDAEYKRNQNLPPEEQKVIAVPDYQSFIARYGDVLLVCCDGVFEAAEMDHSKVATIAYEQKLDLISQVLTHETEDEDAEPQSIESAFSDFLWDPAIVSRRLIAESIIRGSHDNHTAIVVSFAPHPLTLPELPEEVTNTNKDVHALHHINNLRLTDVIPGPQYDCSDSTFLRAHQDDLGPDAIDDDLRKDIRLLDEAVSSARHELAATQLPCESPFEPDFHHDYSVPPIILVYPVSAPPTQATPDLFQQLFASMIQKPR